MTFESALHARVDSMVDACTRCGKCVEACPVAGAAGLETAARENPVSVIGGIIDLLRNGQSGLEGNEPARQWAQGCIRSGDCIEACDYGVNPRFLLAMARVAIARAKHDVVAQRRGGVEGFRHVAHDVKHISRLQLDDALLDRLGQGGKSPPAVETPPDFVFYTGCNVLKTPHIALLALDIMDAIGINYSVMGGPTHCCGIQQLRSGDLASFGRFAENTLDKLSNSKSGEVLSWCPSCHVQYTEMTLPAVEKTRGSKAVRDDAVHDVRAQKSRPAAAAACSARADADRAAQAPRHPRCRRGRRGDIVRHAGHRACRSATTRGRDTKQRLEGAAGLSPRIATSKSSKPPKPPASTRWLRSITPITASFARMSATGRSAS